MPEGGVDVVVPYDTINEEATSNDTFTVAHMLTTGENAGRVDIIEDVRKGVRRPALPCKQPVALRHQLDQI